MVIPITVLIVMLRRSLLAVKHSSSTVVPSRVGAVNVDNSKVNVFAATDGDGPKELSSKSKPNLGSD